MSLKPMTVDEVGTARSLLVREPPQPLESVAYLIFDGFPWPMGHRFDGIHEIDIGTEFTFRQGVTLSVRWAMDGLDEGLWIGVGSDARTEIAEHVTSQAVRGQWEHLFGLRLVDLGVAAHVPNEDSQPRVCAIRMFFETGKSVTFALGEVREGNLSYQPDGILVFFEEQDGDQYVANTFSTTIPRLTSPL